MGCRSASIAPKSTHQTNPPRNFSSTKNKIMPAASPGRVCSRASARRPGPRRAVTVMIQPPSAAIFSSLRRSMPSAAALQPSFCQRTRRRRTPAADAWLRNRWISGPCTEKRKVSAAQSLSFTAASPPTCCAARPAQSARPESIFCPRRILSAAPRHTMLPECPPYQGRCAAG